MANSHVNMNMYKHMAMYMDMNINIDMSYTDMDMDVSTNMDIGAEIHTDMDTDVKMDSGKDMDMDSDMDMDMDTDIHGKLYPYTIQKTNSVKSVPAVNVDMFTLTSSSLILASFLASRAVSSATFVPMSTNYLHKRSSL
jgi:hypothetical protein